MLPRTRRWVFILALLPLIGAAVIVGLEDHGWSLWQNAGEIPRPALETKAALLPASENIEPLPQSATSGPPPVSPDYKNLRLVATIVREDPLQSRALIGTEGHNVRFYASGSAVQPDLTLEVIGKDRVQLRHAGGMITLYIQYKDRGEGGRTTASLEDAGSHRRQLGFRTNRADQQTGEPVRGMFDAAPPKPGQPAQDTHSRHVSYSEWKAARAAKGAPAPATNDSAETAPAQDENDLETEKWMSIMDPDTPFDPKSLDEDDGADQSGQPQAKADPQAGH